MAGWDIIIAGGFCPIFDLCDCDSLKGMGRVLLDDKIKNGLANGYNLCYMYNTLHSVSR